MPAIFLDTEIYIWALIYFAISAILHWRFHLDLGMLWYGIGGIIGIHLLLLMERVLKLNPSPLRTVLAQLVLIPVAIFVLTSSVFVLGKGVLLFLNLYYMYILQKELKATGSLTSWFRQFKVMPPLSRQKQYLYASGVIFIVETFLFIFL